MLHSENMGNNHHDLVPNICSLDKLEREDTTKFKSAKENKKLGLKVGVLGESNDQL